MRILVRILAAACVLAASATARADVGVELQLNASGQALARRLGITSSELQQRIRAQVDQLFAADHVATFLEAFADAAAFSGHGIGVDYACPCDVVVGLSGAGALATDDQLGGSDQLARGVAANLALTAGVGLARWGAPRVTLFANGFYHGDGTAGFDGSVASAGAHVQVQLVLPQARNAAVRWRGVAVTTGLELTRWTLGAARPVSQDFTVRGGSMTADVSLASNGRFDVAATTFALPVELSTGLQLAKILGFYVGAGADLDLGSATLAAAQRGTVTDASDRALGTVAVTGTASHAASPLVARALAGTELELGQFVLFAQVEAAPSLASVGVGLRFAL